MQDDSDSDSDSTDRDSDLDLDSEDGGLVTSLQVKPHIFIVGYCFTSVATYYISMTYTTILDTI